MTDLLSCPFCGGKATLEEVPEKSMGGIRWTVGCNETDEDEEGSAFAVLCYGYQSLTTFATQHEAIAAWNRRASAARIAELVAALRPFAKRADYFDERLKANGGKWEDDDTYCDDPPSDIYLKQLRDARAAIAKAEGKP